VDKHEKFNETEVSGGKPGIDNDFIRETDGTKVKNPNQNNQIHKQSLGPNARR
jgi:hypothetical protein